MRRIVFALAWLLLGCATKDRYVAPPIPPNPPLAEMPAPPLSFVPAGVFEQSDVLRLMTADPIPEVSVKDAQKAVGTATARSVVRPTAANMTRAVVIYPYYEGAVYEIQTRELMPTSLVFSEPEEVIKVAADDYFDVTIQVVGTEPHRQWHVVITPKGPDLDSLLMVLTTKEAYYLKVVSRTTGGMVAVRWKHPASPTKLPRLLNPGIYYRGYTVEATEGQPEWFPIDIWDTGLGGKTLIKFPERASVGEIPTFYVIGADGQRTLTNWQKRGDWYVIPRLITRGELRMGHESEVVTIVRGASYYAVFCPSQLITCPEGDL